MNNIELLNEIIEQLNKANKNELSFIELKENNINSEIFGQNISAIANVCILEELEKGYIVLGVSDKTLELKGVKFDPFNLKHNSSNQDLEMWLRSMILGVDFKFIPFKNDKEQSFLIVEISKALGRLATFKNESYIRIGKNTTKLNKHQELFNKILRSVDKNDYWRISAKKNLTEEELFSLLECNTYFDLQQINQTSKERTIARFKEEGFILNNGGKWDITNLGALLFAKDMKNFPNLSYKTPRVITYDGDNKLSTVYKDIEGKKGYISGFEDLIMWIDSQIPQPQKITKIFREQKKHYPEKAIRELVANALIHQDFNECGARVIIEIYKNHIEISNPGNCLIDPKRIIGAVPKARNELLVDVMKRLNICETRGSGIIRTIEGIENFQLPGPKFIDMNNAFKASIFSYKSFNDLSIEEKKRACIQHVEFKYAQGSYANNESLRKRFGLGEKKANMISKLVKNVKDEKGIKSFDPKNNSKRFIKYIPYWA